MVRLLLDAKVGNIGNQDAPARRQVHSDFVRARAESRNNAAAFQFLNHRGRQGNGYGEQRITIRDVRDDVGGRVGLDLNRPQIVLTIKAGLVLANRKQCGVQPHHPEVAQVAHIHPARISDAPIEL